MIGTTEQYDVVVLGAGIAGLNAAAVAAEYVGHGGRILLVDRRPGPGGMWNDTYEYVRLHQPHRFFTASDITWTQGHRPDHLASKDEVLEHLQHCVEVIAGRTRLETGFGWEYVTHAERGDVVEVTLRDSDDATRTVTASRLVKAFGYDVATNQPLPLSSDGVRSISPDEHDVRTGAIAEDFAPVWVVGGGKTGMDTALALVSGQPDRDVRMLVGGGTAFATRDNMFPTGIRRWVGGSRATQWATDYSLRFDGTNEADTMRWLLDNGGHSPVGAPRDYEFGILGLDEARTIRAGVREFVRDYLEDVQDTASGPELVLRSGSGRPVEAGTWVVNCTGYLARRRDRAYEPYASASGRVLTITDRSATTHLTSYAGYFLTHALMRDLLPLTELYEMDLVQLREKAKPAMGVAGLALTMHNMGVLLDVLPRSVFFRTRLDFDRWYPMPRTLGGAARFLLTHRRVVARQRRTLDALPARGIRSGPLGPASAGTEPTVTSSDPP